MCSTKAKVSLDRPVLQPTCNRVILTRQDNNKTIKSTATETAFVPPKPNSPRPAAVKRGSDNVLNSSSDKIIINNIPKVVTAKARVLERKKSQSFKETSSASPTRDAASLSYSSSLIVESPGSIAAVRREQMALQHAQRKMKIAHYGRSKSAKFDASVSFGKLNVEYASPNASITSTASQINSEEEKRCSFITTNSDPVFIAYHDKEWGVPVHDDKVLFELLVLSGAQVGTDWTSILKKRHTFRNAFSGFDAEAVSNLSEKQITSISAEYGIDISRVRGVVDNSHRILEIRKEFGSFDKYIWGFVNNKPISTKYKFGYKIPVKTSKSESISKDMVRRGFRFVGPTVIHSFMQAAGLTNDHLITCQRHKACSLLAFHTPTATEVPQTT